MIDLDYTLADFFGVDTEAIGGQQRKELQSALGKRQDLSEIRERAGVRPHDVVLDTVLDKAVDALDTQLTTVLIRGWTQWRKVRNRFREAVAEPDKTFVVPLLEHKLTSTHKPHVDVFLGNQRLGRIDIEVSLEIVIKGASLRVENAAIAAIDTGSCAGTGKIKIEGVQIAKRESQPLPFAGTIRLTQPVPLQPATDSGMVGDTLVA